MARVFVVVAVVCGVRWAYCVGSIGLHGIVPSFLSELALPLHVHLSSSAPVLSMVTCTEF